jgi:hypothetical protein
LTEDINKKIISDFEEKNFDIVSKLLLSLNEQGNSDRIVRCVLYLAKGKLHDLEYYKEQALMDWRDVIYWAEYDSSGLRVRDFNLPFS